MKSCRQMLIYFLYRTLCTPIFKFTNQNENGKVMLVGMENPDNDKEIVFPSTTNDYTVIGIIGPLENASGIIKVTIPKTIKIISEQAFIKFVDLNNFVVEEGSQYFTAVDGILYTQDKKEVVSCPQSTNIVKYSQLEQTNVFREYSFYNITNIQEVVILHTIEFNDYSLWFKNLKKLYLYCSKLTHHDNFYSFPTSTVIYAYSDEIKKLFPNNKVELNENNEPSKKSGNISLVLSIVLSVVVLAIIIGIIIYCNNKNNKKKEKFSYSYSSYSGSTVEIKN